MSLRIPTTQEIVDLNIANLEAALNQTSPDTAKAFIKVLAALEAMNSTGLYRFAIERAKQNLALTANAEGLQVFADEYNVQRKPAVAAQLDIEAPAAGGTTLPITASLTGDSNTEKYYPNASYNEAAGKIEATVTAETPGIAGNLNVSDTMTLDEPITGVDNTWTVTAVAVLGLDQEDIEAWRRRILLELQTTGGGGNGVDYRTWAEETPGCFRAFPYSGAPIIVGAFLDGDMEDPGVSDWTAGNSAILSKETTLPESGDRCLRITRNGVNYPYASQAVLTPLIYYRITGYARGDGASGNPRVMNGATGAVLWTGSTSTDWQSFDVTWEASDPDIVLRVQSTSGSGYSDYDSVVINQTSFPGDRSVFVEAETTIDPDGIAPQVLLDSVRSYINTDPVTGKNRPSLGDTDENLYIQSILRTTLNVEIRDLVVDGDIEADVKADIEAAVDVYLRAVAPYILGVDPPATQNDLITDLTLSQVIQDILNPVGGSASGVGIYIVANVFIPSYALGQGELLKLGAISYV